MTTPKIPRCLFFVTALAFVIAPAVQAQEYQVVYQVQSPFQLITILDSPNGYRQLIFDGKFDGTDAIQSEMNLANHTELMLSYTRHIMTALPLVEKPKRILIVGLGGACMQRYLYELLPDVTIETAELDPEVRNIAVEYFFFKEDSRQIVHLGDGRMFIENSRDRYDIIFLDAFSATSIPYGLTTQEFLAAVKAHLSDGGLACANLWDGASEYPDMLKTYAAVFPDLRVVKCIFSGNSILLAFPKKTDLTAQAWTEKARAFEKTHPTGLDLPVLIEPSGKKPTIATEAKVLHDKDQRPRSEARSIGSRIGT